MKRNDTIPQRGELLPDETSTPEDDPAAAIEATPRLDPNTSVAPSRPKRNTKQPNRLGDYVPK